MYVQNVISDVFQEIQGGKQEKGFFGVGSF